MSKLRDSYLYGISYCIFLYYNIFYMHTANYFSYRPAN